MGLIASVLAYLSAVTVLAGALLMSFDALLYPAGQTTLGQHTVAAAAKPSVTQSPLPPASNVRPAPPVIAEADDPHPASENAVAQRLHVRRLVRQARARNRVFQQEPNALGYAAEPSASFLYDRFQ